jgi:hypothetical protein
MIRFASMLVIPALMFGLSFAVPALGSPVALLVGAMVGYMLPRLWLGRDERR